VRLTLAASDNTRAGLVAAFGALSDLSNSNNATYNEVADKVALSVNRIRNNALAQADPAVLLDVMQLGKVMSLLQRQERYQTVVTMLRVDATTWTWTYSTPR
jgi:hypothetical protein